MDNKQQHKNIQDLNIGTPGEGRVSGVSWMAIPCDVGGNPVEYIFQVKPMEDERIR